MKKTICLDFDGVLNTYTGWAGELELFQARLGAREFVVRLLRAGYDVAVHSTRNRDVVAYWLYLNDFPKECRVCDRKPPALVYLDDRGVTFNGDFDEALEAIQRFRAYWEQPYIDPVAEESHG